MLTNFKTQNNSILFSTPIALPYLSVSATMERLDTDHNGQLCNDLWVGNNPANQRGEQLGTTNATIVERAESGERRADSAGSIKQIGINHIMGTSVNLVTSTLVLH